MTDALVPSEPTRRHYDPHDRIGVGIGTPNGVFYRCTNSNDEGHEFERVDQPGLFEFFTHAQIAEIEQSTGYRYNPGWFAREEMLARQVAGAKRFLTLDKGEIKQVFWRQSWCDAFLRLEAEGRTSRSDDKMQAAIELIDAEMTEKKIAKLRKQRAKTEETLWSPPTVKTLRRWLKPYTVSGRKPASLCTRHRRGPRPKFYDSDVEVLIRRHVEGYADSNKPTMVNCYNSFQRAFKALNQKRAADGLKPLAGPKEGAFCSRIRLLDKYSVTLAREGEGKARTKFHYVGPGLDVTRPGQRIEIDHWNIPLHVLLELNGVWATLSLKKRAEIERCRWHVCVAIDCATRVILGMNLSRTANADSAIATLAMVGRNKQTYADHVGALTPWNMCCGIEYVATDMGPEFINDEFRYCCVCLNATFDTPPAAQAEKRARIERLFGTSHQRLITHFTGRTFEDIDAKGDYDSKKNSSMTTDELIWTLTRFYIDVYHNEPHSGLGGETPKNAWKSKSDRYGTVAPPDQDTHRMIFGLRLTRIVSKSGVLLLNLHYQSPVLHEFFCRIGASQKVEVRLDPFDLGWISVKVGERSFITVPCIKPELAGVHVRDWIATIDDLRRRYGDEAEIAEDIVFKALAEIQAMGQAAAKRANITTQPTAEEIDRAYNKLMIPWSSEQTAMDFDGRQLLDEPDLIPDVVGAAPEAPNLTPVVARETPKGSAAAAAPAPEPARDDYDDIDSSWGNED